MGIHVDEMSVRGEDITVQPLQPVVEQVGVHVDFAERMLIRQETPHTHHVCVPKLLPLQCGVHVGQRIVGLLILAITDVAEESSVIQNHSLPAELHIVVRVAITDCELVEFDDLVIEDRGVLSPAIAAAVEVLGAEIPDRFEFRYGIESVPLGRLDPGPDARGRGGGIQQSVVLIHGLDTRPCVEKKIDPVRLFFLGMARTAWRGDCHSSYERNEQAMHRLAPSNRPWHDTESRAQSKRPSHHFLC